MGIYDSNINKTWDIISAKGGVVDVIRPVEASFDAGDDVYTHVQGELSVDIDASVATLNLINIANGSFTNTGVIKINDELIKYGAVSGGTFSSLTRGYKESTAALHTLNAIGQLTYSYFNTRAVFSQYKAKDVDGESIQRDDKKLLIPGKDSTLFDTKCKVISGNDVYQVIDVKTIAPDGVSKILFITQVRQQ